MPSNDYHFITHWRVQGTVKEVEDIMSDAPDLVRWWPSVYLDVNVLKQGDTNGLGKVEGRGIWTFKQDGPWVDIVYDWKISAEKPLLRNFSFLIKPIFEANHRWAMARGEESLRLELERRHARTEEERALIPVPPPPTTTSSMPLLLGSAATFFAVGALGYLLIKACTSKNNI
jgi:hypothetical protein